MGEERVFMTLKHVIRQYVAQNNFRVTFEKKDGSVREMLCTLNSEIIDEYCERKGIVIDPDKPKKADNPMYLDVFDIEADGFRKVNMEKLLTFEIEKK